MSDRIAILLTGKRMGGDTKVVFNLIEGLTARGLQVDLLLSSSIEFSSDQLPQQAKVIDLQGSLTERASVTVKLLPALIQYLQQNKPKALISNLSLTNAIVVLSKFFTFPTPKFILVEHAAISSNSNRTDELHSKVLPTLMRVLYPRADAVVSVSQQIAEDLQTKYNLKNVHAIANAVVSSRLDEQAKAPLDHPWFQADSIPVFLGVGRLEVQKDFTTLIKAFAMLREEIPAKLVILGEGRLRSRLEAQIKASNLQADIDLPGFDSNPYRYMSRATTFVLSSRWEALPTVLIEAMACGCQVIATQCRSGVSEILCNGKFGQIIAIEDPVAMASAMKESIKAPISSESLRLRANDFGIDRAVDRYLELL